MWRVVIEAQRVCMIFVVSDESEGFQDVSRIADACSAFAWLMLAIQVTSECIRKYAVSLFLERLRACPWMLQEELDHYHDYQSSHQCQV